MSTLMAQRGLSQRALAARMGVADSTLSRVLSGQSRPSLRLVLQAMAALDVERPEALFDPASLTGRVRYWATPERIPRREAFRRSVVARVLAGGPLPGERRGGARGRTLRSATGSQ